MTKLENLPLSKLRRELAEARIALRAAQDAYTLARAQAEQQIVDANGGEKGLGSTKEERERKLTLGLQGDKGYLQSLVYLRQLQDRTDRLQALVDGRLDELSERRQDMRARLADAMLALAATLGADSLQPNDVADTALIQTIVASADEAAGVVEELERASDRSAPTRA